MTVSNRDRWSHNPYAAMQPHMGALQHSGIRYEHGAPTGFASQSQPRASYVGAPMFPPIQIPAFPVQPNVSINPAQPSPQPSPSPQNPQPQNPQPQDPSAPLTLAEWKALEQAKVTEALAAEAAAGGGSLAAFAQAAQSWQDASQAAAQIASMTATSAPIASDNAGVRAYHYHFRSLKNAAVANQTEGPPTGGWNWPPIPQKPELSPPVFNPSFPPAVPEPPPSAPPASGSALLALGLALGAAAVYVAVRALRIKVG